MRVRFRRRRPWKRSIREWSPRPPLPISERNNLYAERLVRSAAAQVFGRGTTIPVFEHGHWWVIDDLGRVYAVVEANPGIGKTGLDFEDLG